MAPNDTYCGHCGDPADMTCTKCGEIKYCTLECLEADEHVHQTLCNQVTDFQTPPVQDTRLAILLPEDSPNPQFIWMDVDIVDTAASHDPAEEINPAYGIPEVDPQNGATRPRYADALKDSSGTLSICRPTEIVVGKLGSGMHLDHTILAAHRLHSAIAPPNQCIEHLTNGRSSGSWRGPLLLFGMTKCVDSVHCINLSISDLTIAIEGLLHHLNMPSGPRKVQGVKINAVVPKYESVDIPSNHPIFTHGTLSDISVQIGGPMLTWRNPHSRSSAGPSIAETWLLRLNLDPADARVGETPFDPYDNISMLVVNVDRMALERELVYGLVQYAAALSVRITDLKKDWGGLREDIQEVVDEISLVHMFKTVTR